MKAEDRKDLSGQVFGRLTAISYDGKDKSRHSKWSCICECGNELVVLGTNLLKGNTKSCGCLQKEIMSERGILKGLSMTPEYSAWRAAVSRCTNSTNKFYSNYGGRGITICEEWLPPAEVGFLKFLEDMGQSNGLTLERIDVNIGYSKENCKWEDWYTQNYNQRKRSTNTSGKTGVTFCKLRNKWKASIDFKGVHKSLGSYNTFEEAKAAREQAEIELDGKLKGH